MKKVLQIISLHPFAYLQQNLRTIFTLTYQGGTRYSEVDGITPFGGDNFEDSFLAFTVENSSKGVHARSKITLDAEKIVNQEKKKQTVKYQKGMKQDMQTIGIWKTLKEDKSK